MERILPQTPEGINPDFGFLSPWIVVICYGSHSTDLGPEQGWLSWHRVPRPSTPAAKVFICHPVSLARSSGHSP